MAVTPSVPDSWRIRFPDLPDYCGNEVDPGLIDSSDVRDWSRTPTTEDQLRMERYLDGFDLSAKRVLHIGIGNSGFARRFHRHAGEILGTTVDLPELSRADALHMPNYRACLHNKYSGTPKGSAWGRFDFILDNNPTSVCCCLFHLKQLLQFYGDHLAKGGQVVTDQVGLAWVARDPPTHESFGFDFGDLAAVAPAVGLEAIRIDRLTYVLCRHGEWRGETGHRGRRAWRKAVRFPEEALRSLAWHLRRLVRALRRGLRGG